MDKRIEKRKALAALNKVIMTESDIEDAFFCSLGPVCLKYGTPGIPPKFKKAFGISHIIAKRDYEHANNPKAFPETGLQVAKKLMDVIVYGKIVDTKPTKQCVYLQKDGFEAVISQNWHGNKVNWLLTGWKVIKKVRIQKVLSPVSLIAILTHSTFRRTKAGLYCVWPTRHKVTFCRLKVGAKHDAKLQNFL